MRIYLLGFMASGKTSLGKRLASQLKLNFLDLDSFIEQNEKQTIAEIFSQKGETTFREIEQITLKQTLNFENIIISTGGGTPCFFDNINFINANGLSIYLKISAKMLASRLKQSRTKRPLISNKTDTELDLFVEQILATRELFYAKAHFTLELTNLKKQEMVTQLISTIKQNRNREMIF